MIGIRKLKKIHGIPDLLWMMDENNAITSSIRFWLYVVSRTSKPFPGISKVLLIMFWFCWFIKTFFLDCSDSKKLKTQNAKNRFVKPIESEHDPEQIRYSSKWFQGTRNEVEQNLNSAWLRNLMINITGRLPENSHRWFQ